MSTRYYFTKGHSNPQLLTAPKETPEQYTRRMDLFLADCVRSVARAEKEERMAMAARAKQRSAERIQQQAR
jgi:hypothetical protein